MVFHGQGGYDWATIYNMPMWLRKFVFRKMKEYYEEKNNSGPQDLVAQTKAIREGKIQLPDQFKGRLKQPPKY